MKFTAQILNQHNIENIHDQTIYLLGKHGIAIEDNEIIDLLRKHGAELNNSKVKFPEKLISESLKTTPSEFKLSARNPDKNIHIGKNHPAVLAPAAGFIQVSSFSEGIRHCTKEDYKNFLSLSQIGSVDVNQIGLLYPDNIERTVDFCLQANEAIHLCNKPIFGLTQNEEIAQHTINMAKIAVDRACENYIIGIVNGISPLKWDSTMLGAIKAFALSKQPLVVSVCSMAGSTSPVNLTQTILQNNAEVLTGIIVAQLINPGTPIVYGNTSAVVDFRSMNLAIGSPETQVIGIASSQLADYYKIPFRGGGSLTDSKEFDIQAGIESALNLSMSILPKYDLIMQAIGVSESFMTLSYEKWIIDEEIIERLKYLNNYKINKLNSSDSDMIASVAEGESFMLHPDTLLNFKNEIFHATISDRTTRPTWNKFNTHIQQKAEIIWKDKLKNFTPPTISKSTSKALHDYISRNFNV